MTPHSRHTHPTRRAVLASLTVLVGVVAALTLAGPAAASPCGDKVLADWFDNGRIDRLYPLHCYEEAIDSIPADIRDYADAEEVISRALQAAVGGRLAEGGCDPTPSEGQKGCTGAGGSNGKGGKNGGGAEGGGGSENGGTEVAPEVDTSGPSSIPIPLIVLGGMSLALLAAGGLGYLSRRRHAADADDDEPTLG